MNRRSFLAGILASGFAPAAIGSGVRVRTHRALAALRHGSADPIPCVASTSKSRWLQPDHA